MAEGYRAGGMSWRGAFQVPPCWGFKVLSKVKESKVQVGPTWDPCTQKSEVGGYEIEHSQSCVTRSCLKKGMGVGLYFSGIEHLR